MPHGARSRRDRSKKVGRTQAVTQTESSNPFGALASTGLFGTEYNAHLPERFISTSSIAYVSIPDDNTPASEPSRVTNDVRDYYNLEKRPSTGGKWLDKPEIPHPSEVFREQTGFTHGELDRLIEIEDVPRPYKVKGGYESNEDYLRTKYELLREDAVRPLREVINEVRSNPFQDEAEYKNQSIGIYDPVYITALVFSLRGLATRVAFSLNRAKKHIRWEQSKRLITGTLVALSPADDAFQTQCVLATVAARPLSALAENPPQIDLFFARPEDQEIDPMTKWIMVECRSSFFEASRHILKALQHMMREPFPLSAHLVKAQREVEPPSYIRHNPYMNLSSLVDAEQSKDFENVHVLNVQEWLSGASNSLDSSQSRALRRMLTKSLAIVQGPPGTGKTFVSVKALKVLLDNLQRGDAPLVVTAQTNHAVDQILRHTMSFEPKYVRLGGRSKDKDIQKRTIFQIRSNSTPQKQFGGQRAQASIALKKLGTKCKTLLEPMEANRPPVDHRILMKLKLITSDQAESLETDSACLMGTSVAENQSIAMEQWLGRCLTPCRHPIQPDDYSVGFQEDDFEVEQLQEAEAEANQDDDDIEALHGEVTLLSDNYRGKGESLTGEEVRKILDETTDLTTIPTSQRGSIYNYFLKSVKKLLIVEARKIAKEYETLVLSRKIGQWNEDARLLSEARIIGCTTTGLSKYRALLSAIKPQVVLVEEAAETQEAPVAAACFPTLQHLILVGDHMQLRPHTQVHDFEDEPFFLNLSLFERLVNNNVEFDTLTKQRRMIPEIRRLSSLIYNNIVKDHPTVKDPGNRPPVEGMGGNNSFFFCHEWPEERDTNASVFNNSEALMVVNFLDYLVLNGIDLPCITVLTFYNGQRRCIMKHLRAHRNLGCRLGVQVVTVDGYQGEENDIVLLSLVRSNRKRAIGFLSSENRACVALSRAKRGFYIFGNAELLACESGTWASVVDIMHSNKTKAKVSEGQLRRLGYNLPLACAKHGNKVWIEHPSDFDDINGGCDLPCNGKLPCGHMCPYRCHPFEHKIINCSRKCSRRVESCGHACMVDCCDPCKCHKCDHRSQGVRAMIRHTARPVSRRGGRGETGSQSASKATLSSKKSHRSNDRVSEWGEYARGGVQDDDARLVRKKREQEARLAESERDNFYPPLEDARSKNLMEFSPERGASLLIEIETETGTGTGPDEWPLQQCVGQSGPPSYANVAASSSTMSKGKGREEGYMNLLD